VPAVQSALSTSVAEYGTGLEVEDPLELRLDAGHVVRELVAVEQVALLGATARVTDHPRGAAGERERLVTGELEAPQTELAHEVADVQRIGGGVEADVDADRPLVEP
jgi:hypothetical protein